MKLGIHPESAVRRVARRRRHFRAFTLIELLIATAVFAMVLVVMNTIFSGALTLGKTTTRMVEEGLPLNRLVALMKSDLRNILPPGATGVLAGPIVGGSQLALQGRSTGSGRGDFVFLQFSTTSGITDDSTILKDPRELGFYEPAPWPEAQRVQYSLRESETPGNRSGQELIRSVFRNPLAINEEYSYEQPILDGVESMEFMFYDGTYWINTWNSTNQEIALPLAIKVTLEFPEASLENPITQPLFEFVFPILTQTMTNAVAAAEQETGTGAGQQGGTQQGGGQQGGGQQGGGGFAVGAGPGVLAG